MMRSEHVLLVLLALAYIIYRLATKVTGAASLPTPPDDDEPKTEQPPEYIEPDLVVLPKVS